MKIKNLLTGSNYKKDEDSEDKLPMEGIEIFELLEGLASKLFEIDAERIFYKLKRPPPGFDNHWFINASSKMIERFPASMQVELIEEYSEDSYLCFAGGCNIIVKKELISEKVEY